VSVGLLSAERGIGRDVFWSLAARSVWSNCRYARRYKRCDCLARDLPGFCTARRELFGGATAANPALGSMLRERLRARFGR